MTDTAFCDRIEFARDLVMATSSDLRRYLGKLHMVEVAREMGPKLTGRHACAATGSFYEPMSAEDAARFDVAEQYIQYADGFYSRVWTPTIERLAQDFKSIWAAFESFTTKELNVEPLTLLNAFCPPVARQVRATLLRYKKVEADDEAVAEYVEGIDGAWKSCARS